MASLWCPVERLCGPGGPPVRRLWRAGWQKSRKPWNWGFEGAGLQVCSPSQEMKPTGHERLQAYQLRNGGLKSEQARDEQTQELNQPNQKVNLRGWGWPTGELVWSIGAGEMLQRLARQDTASRLWTWERMLAGWLADKRLAKCLPVYLEVSRSHRFGQTRRGRRRTPTDGVGKMNKQSYAMAGRRDDTHGTLRCYGDVLLFTSNWLLKLINYGEKQL